MGSKRFSQQGDDASGRFVSRFVQICFDDLHKMQVVGPVPRLGKSFKVPQFAQRQPHRNGLTRNERHAYFLHGAYLRLRGAQPDATCAAV